MKGGRSQSLDTLKLQNFHAQQQLKQQNSKSQLQNQELFQQKLLKTNGIQNTNYTNISTKNIQLSTNSSKKDMNADPQEIKLFVQQQNVNYNLLLSQKLDLEEEVKYLRGENESLVKSQQFLTITKSKQNLEQTSKDSGTFKDYSAIKVDVMNYSIRNKELENELFQLQQQMRLYKLQLTNESPKKFLSNTDYDPHQFSNKISDLGKIIADQKTDLQSIQMKLKEKDRQIEGLNDNIYELKSKMNIMDQERQLSEKGYQNEIQRVKDSQAMELDSLRKLNKQLDDSISKAQTALSSSEQAKQELLIQSNRQIVELQDELKKLNRQKTQMEQELSSNLMDLKGDKHLQQLHFTNKVKELENTIQQWETKFYKQKMANESEIDQLKELQEQRIELLKQEMGSKESQYLKKFDNFQQLLREAEKDKVNKMEIIKQHKIELEDIKGKLKMNRDSYEIQIEDLRQEIKRFGQSKNELMAKIQEKERQNQKLLEEIESYKNEIKSLELNVEEIQSEVLEIKRLQTEEQQNDVVEEKVAELEVEFQKRAKEYENEKLLELKAQRDKYIGEIIQLEIKHKQEVERLKDRLEGYQMKDANSQKSIDQRIQDVKDNYESQIKHMVQQQESEMNKIKDENDKAVENIKKDCFQREEKIRQDYESALQTQKIDFELSQLKPLKKEYNDFQKASKEKTQLLESQLSMIKQDMEGQVSYQKSLLEVQKKNYEGQLSQEKKLIKSLESKIEEQIKEIQDSQLSIQQQQEQIKQLNTVINIIKCEKAEQCTFLEDEISKIHQAYISKQDEVIKKYQEELKTTNSDNLRFTLKMKKQFDELLQVEHSKYEKVLMEYEELLRLYESKGCREIDANLISNLKEECIKTQEELKYLILEVVNREKMYNKIFTNYQETEFMQMLLKKADKMEQIKHMLANNEFPSKESEQSNIEISLRNSDNLNLQNLNMSTKNNNFNNNDFLPMVNTTKSFKGFKTEETPSTSANSGPLKFTQKFNGRGFEVNTSQSKSKTPLSDHASVLSRGYEVKRPNTTMNQPLPNQSMNQGVPKQIQPHYMLAQLNQTNSVFKGDLQQISKSNYNSSTLQQQSGSQEQFNSLDVQPKQNQKQKMNSTKHQYHKQNSNIINDNSFIEAQNGKRKYNIRERRCLSQMSDYQEDSQIKQQHEYLHTHSNLNQEEPILVLNAQNVNIQRQLLTPTTTAQGVQRRKYPINKEIIKSKAGMYKGAPTMQLVNQSQRYSTGNISLGSQINIQQELLPALQNNQDDEMDMNENMQLRLMNEKSMEIQNHQHQSHNDSQIYASVNVSNHSNYNSSSLPPESRKPSYAQIYAQIFMNQVSRVVKTTDPNPNLRKKFV